ncbi:hypothetical protein B0H13DRAFT_2301338 [Mycena leptocephala]|nr:hypothetical protein B0H13DRAFT_2301338 [Mycena leptocephala]
MPEVELSDLRQQGVDHLSPPLAATLLQEDKSISAFPARILQARAMCGAKEFTAPPARAEEAEFSAPPTHVEEAPSPASDSEDEADRLHARPYIRCILLLVAFLHTKNHVSFRACALILLALNFIFSTIPGNLLEGQAIPRSLTTIFSRLELSDKFTVRLICHLCHRIFDVNDKSNVCPDLLGNDDDDGNTSEFNFQRTPHLVAPIQLLSDGLRESFKRPGMVPEVNSWKKRRTVPGELKSMQDAQVWSTIKGPDKTSFFYGRSAEKEIRIGTTLSLDW